MSWFQEHRKNPQRVFSFRAHRNRRAHLDGNYHLALVGKSAFVLMVAKIIAVVFVLFWNFFMKKKIRFLSGTRSR